MALSKRQLQVLHKMLSLTRSQELTCDECLKRMAEFAENVIDGQSIPDNLRAIEHHLALCGDCREEFEVLIKALEADE